jgi:LPPG:FO 2-phospho-L-lactate transferase
VISISETVPNATTRWITLSGGVGGAKFAAGMNMLAASGEHDILINTADDFNHLGLRICPDLDSVTYALAGLNDRNRGWGRSEESWNCMATLKEIGAESWFSLGDKDLGLHLFRSHQLSQGGSLYQITRKISTSLGVTSRLIPMSESAVKTIVSTDCGELDFQDYFVRHQCRPTVRSVRYSGVETAKLHDIALSSLQSPQLEAVFIAPSNPFLSIDPILNLPAVRSMIKALEVPVVAISPLVGGRALKGPLDKMLSSMGKPINHQAIADHYAGLIDCLIIDSADISESRSIDIPTHTTQTIMNCRKDERSLAEQAIVVAKKLKSNLSSRRPAPRGTGRDQL